MHISIKCFFCGKPLLNATVTEGQDTDFNTVKHQCPASAIQGIKLDVEINLSTNIKPKANDA